MPTVAKGKRALNTALTKSTMKKVIDYRHEHRAYMPLGAVVEELILAGLQQHADLNHTEAK